MVLWWIMWRGGRSVGEVGADEVVEGVAEEFVPPAVEESAVAGPLVSFGGMDEVLEVAAGADELGCDGAWLGAFGDELSESFDA